jgi:hypothetical protein
MQCSFTFTVLFMISSSRGWMSCRYRILSSIKQSSHILQFNFCTLLVYLVLAVFVASVQSPLAMIILIHRFSSLKSSAANGDLRSWFSETRSPGLGETESMPFRPRMRTPQAYICLRMSLGAPHTRRNTSSGTTTTTTQSTCSVRFAVSLSPYQPRVAEHGQRRHPGTTTIA